MNNTKALAASLVTLFSLIATTTAANAQAYDRNLQGAEHFDGPLAYKAPAAPAPQIYTPKTQTSTPAAAPAQEGPSAGGPTLQAPEDADEATDYTLFEDGTGRLQDGTTFCIVPTECLDETLQGADVPANIQDHFADAQHG